MKGSTFKRKQHRHQEGSTLVMTLGTMVLLVLVLIVSSTFTMRSITTVKDQSVSLEAQYAAESGLAWAKAWANEFSNRVTSLSATTSKPTRTDLATMIGQACGTTVSGSSGTCAVTNVQAMGTFFDNWDPQPDFWLSAFNLPNRTINVGNGKSYTVYNRWGNTARPLVAVNRIQWTDNGTGSTAMTYRFCYSVGLYVSKGLGSDSSQRVTGQYPLSETDINSLNTSNQCGNSQDFAAGTLNANQTTNYFEITSVSQGTTIPTNNLAGAVGFMGMSADGNTMYLCAQTATNASQCTGAGKQYYLKYVPAAGGLAERVECWYPSGRGRNAVMVMATAITTFPGSCNVMYRSGSWGDVWVWKDPTTGKISLALDTKNNGQGGGVTTLSNWGGALPSSTPWGRINYMGTCDSSMPTGLCVHQTGNISLPPSGGTGTTPDVITVSPPTTPLDFSGRWVQLNKEDI